jgi:hypothetical protein
MLELPIDQRTRRLLILKVWAVAMVVLIVIAFAIDGR